MEITVAKLASLVGGNIEGCPDTMVCGVGSVDEATAGDVVLADDEKFFRRAADSDAVCILTGLDVTGTCADKSVIRAAEPAQAFMRVLRHFAGDEPLPPVGIGPGTAIGKDAALGKSVRIGANCYIGSGASVGDGCVLFPNVYIGENASIGEGAKLYPGVTIYRKCRVGKNVVLHAGVVIGADGFGYKACGGELRKFPHAGAVEIGDDVEIGANSTVDRAKTGATVIGPGTKIDNLVHIAHNVKIGANCVIVALSGIAGSVEIGDGVTLAAQVGVKDHVRIGDGCVVAARAGVIGDVDAGSTVSGFPARDHALEKRVQAARLHLPEILRRLRALESEVEKLRGRG